MSEVYQIQKERGAMALYLESKGWHRSEDGWWVPDISSRHSKHYKLYRLSAAFAYEAELLGLGPEELYLRWLGHVKLADFLGSREDWFMLGVVQNCFGEYDVVIRIDGSYASRQNAQEVCEHFAKTIPQREGQVKDRWL